MGDWAGGSQPAHRESFQFCRCRCWRMGVQGLCRVGGGGSCKARCERTGEFQAVEVCQLLEGG